MTRTDSSPRREEASLLAQTKDLLRQLGIRGGRRLGQNFLVDRSVLDKIVDAAELKPDDVVMEVGPGLGLLTRELVSRAGRVISIELDERLASLLGKSLPQTNLTIINNDILQLDPATLVEPFQTDRYKVVANLPYYITSPTLRHFLEARVRPTLMVLMVQKEVGEAIVAGPGDMSVLAVSVQFYGKPSIVTHVPAGSFYPVPEVDSVVLRVDTYGKPPVKVSDTDRFFKLVRAGFSSRRKQLRNSLANGLRITSQEALEMLERSSIDPTRRAESLSLEEWAKLENKTKTGA